MCSIVSLTWQNMERSIAAILFVSLYLDGAITSQGQQVALLLYFKLHRASRKLLFSLLSSAMLAGSSAAADRLIRPPGCGMVSY